VHQIWSVTEFLMYMNFRIFHCFHGQMSLCFKPNHTMLIYFTHVYLNHLYNKSRIMKFRSKMDFLRILNWISQNPHTALLQIFKTCPLIPERCFNAFPVELRFTIFSEYYHVSYLSLRFDFNWFRSFKKILKI